MSSLSVPSVSVLLGQGCGGGALALLPANRVIAAEHAWLSPLPPEGASVIVHDDVEHAAEMAERQRVGARELLAEGIVHEVVPERPRPTRTPRASPAPWPAPAPRRSVSSAPWGPGRRADTLTSLTARPSGPRTRGVAPDAPCPAHISTQGPSLPRPGPSGPGSRPRLPTMLVAETTSAGGTP